MITSRKALEQRHSGVRAPSGGILSGADFHSIDNEDVDKPEDFALPPAKRRRLSITRGSPTSGGYEEPSHPTGIRASVLDDICRTHHDLVNVPREREYERAVLVERLASDLERTDRELRILEGRDASTVMEILVNVSFSSCITYVAALDTASQWLSVATSWESYHPFWRRALYLLVKLSSGNRQFPASLFVQGVDIGSCCQTTSS
jgi:hypothetical protein